MSPGSTASVSSFTSVSPPYPEQREPLSLVVRDMKTDRTETPRTAKHWKKSISRNYSGGCMENQENGPVSPSTSTTAEALLSLKSVSSPASAASSLATSRLRTRPRGLQLVELGLRDELGVRERAVFAIRA